MNNHYAAMTLGPDGAAYIATLAGMVRVRTARRGRVTVVGRGALAS